MILGADTTFSPASEHSRRDELSERLRWLVKLRWLALAGVAVAVCAAAHMDLLASAWPLVAVGAAMALLNTGFCVLHRTVPIRTLAGLSAEALVQSSVDVIGLGLLLYFAGGLNNPFVFYFCFHVVIAGILLERREAYAVAALTAAVVLMLGLAEHLGLSDVWRLRGAVAEPGRAPLAQTGWVFTITTTLVISAYMVTTIMERLREQSRNIQRLNAVLAERVERLAAAERDLAAEHERARAILECMDEGVVVVDLYGRVLLANTAAQQSALLALKDTLRQAGCQDKPTRVEGFCHGPLSGENLIELHQHKKQPPCGPPPADASAAEKEAHAHCPQGTPAACLNEALRHGGHLCPATLALLGAGQNQPHSPKPPILTPPASPHLAQVEIQGRWFENTVSAVKTPDGAELGLVVVSRDVTARRSLERQVLHAEKLNALGSLAAGIAHELNTPLGTILGYAQMLLEDEQPAPLELRTIEEQARRCKKIVQGLLDFTRKSSGGGRDSVSPNDLAARVRDLMGHTLLLRGIDLVLDLAEPAPPRVHVAVSEIEQVLVNLVTNAADAIEMGRPAVAGASAPPPPTRGPRAGPPDGRITIQTRAAPGNEVVVAVEDDGPGVQPELGEQIFEPFFTTKAAGKGTGLGLSIARRIAEDHQGRLLLTRRADGQPGARFEFRLPAQATVASAAQ